MGKHLANVYLEKADNNNSSEVQPAAPPLN